MAMCFIKMENWPKCIMHCDDALKIDEGNTKVTHCDVLCCVVM
jgi:hypothetical protein